MLNGLKIFHYAEIHPLTDLYSVYNLYISYNANHSYEFQSSGMLFQMNNQDFLLIDTVLNLDNIICVN